ncbi:MAG: hypothetical protein HY246_04770 [Proteobacteria bacterium]|nr:hypothetical protein [Pseudomonadota bacterium]
MVAKPFNRETLEAAFEAIGKRARAEDRTVEISVYGGSALILTMAHRAATKDVDGVFDRDKVWLRQVARVIAEDNGWDESWLNDGVKGWLSHADTEPSAKRLFGTYPSDGMPGLRVFVAVPEYLFAMKCMAMRIGGVDESADIDDIVSLAEAIGLTDAEQAMNLVSAFYPRDLIPPKTRFGLEEVFGAIASKNQADESGQDETR